MANHKFFISCDWGTSNFRLAVVKTENLEIVSEYKSDKGIKVLYNEFLQQNHLSQEDYFSNYLLSAVKKLPKQFHELLIVSSGMATSNIGMYEMEYAALPFDTEGSNFISKKILFENGLEILLISGVRNEVGVMRGEETQAIGLADFIDKNTNAILILPGTHSKHLTFSDGKFTKLTNYMTGELFEILSQKSILSQSILKPNVQEIIKNAFIDGVKVGAKGKLTSSLFSIRSRDLIKTSSKTENYYYLSGMLIGDELSYLTSNNLNIYMSCPYPLADFYRTALDYILEDKNYTIFNDDTSKKAMLYGQYKILKHYE